MKILVLSDSHSKHNEIKEMPPADVLIHAGDITSLGEQHKTEEFLKWFSTVGNYKFRLFIAGNHDKFFEQYAKADVLAIIPSNVTFLHDCWYENDAMITIYDVNFYGSPVTPNFHEDRWVFNRERGDKITQHWNAISQNCDVLITHGPAYRCLDTTARNEAPGCMDLLDAIERIKSIQIHIFGHIHPAYGYLKKEVGGRDVHFFNACVLNSEYEMQNKPLLFDFDKKNKKIELITY